MERTPLELAIARAGAERTAALDPAVRRARGVVHTPPELARFVAARLLARLAGEVAAGERATIVDPACGPGAFFGALLEAGLRGGRLIGFDLDAASVDAARGLLGRASAERGVSLTLHVTNALAERVEGDVVAVIGNPPWTARSASRGLAESDALLQGFSVDHAGAPLREKKRGVLSDDYVRFFAWALAVVRSAPRGGAIALVTNASYLDGPVHRGLRARLLEELDGVEIVDVGGSALVARAAGGPRDENVFGVRPPAAAFLGWRGPRRGGHARVSYARLRGSRAEKLAVLGASATALEHAGEPGPLAPSPLEPEPPLLRFLPTPSAATIRASGYDELVPLDELFPFHREGVQTNRDSIAVAPTRAALLARLDAIVQGADAGPAREHYDPAVARARIAETPTDERALPIAYRPFEDAYVCPVAPLCHRPRPDLVRAVARGGPVLLSMRKDRGERVWAAFGASRFVPDSSWLSARSSCRTRAFPARDPEGAPNVAQEMRARIEDAIGRALDADELVHYALAVLASRAYRRRFADVLALDYPRIPLPASARELQRIAAAGARVAGAFGGPQGDGDEDEVEVGHRVLRSHALARAVEAADRAYLESSGGRA